MMIIFNIYLYIIVLRHAENKNLVFAWLWYWRIFWVDPGSHDAHGGAAAGAKNGAEEKAKKEYIPF